MAIPALSFTRCDRIGHSRAIFGIIDALRTVGPEVGDVVSLLREPSGKLILQEVTSMIGGESDAHGY